ncbi:hypothetical protein SCLCIDRAFT_32584 [Scleroderma citrinum Foug A]|uniref:Uncharacterized protein n=1 Tax=Scleroderma citrinum Foug A TaxID=1036808 RepID=A0A0C2ZIC6_9AGAM|nr:hypothetical protein SCLCIDRAFT_32584 [Scleroderma citrinum Foug A]
MAKPSKVVPSDKFGENEDNKDNEECNNECDEHEHDEDKDQHNREEEVEFDSEDERDVSRGEGKDSNNEGDFWVEPDGFEDDDMDFECEPSNVKRRQGKDNNCKGRSADALQVLASLLLNSNVLGCMQNTDILDEHYTKNRRPRPPDTSNLAAVIKHRNKCYSKTPKDAHSASPTQIGFYPPKWKDFLEECKVETRTYAAISDPWPHRRQLLNGFILDTINMSVLRWKREEHLVEKGYYPKYRKAMGELLFDDLASWHGEIKKATSNAVMEYETQ